MCGVQRRAAIYRSLLPVRLLHTANTPTPASAKRGSTPEVGRRLEQSRKRGREDEKGKMEVKEEKPTALV